MDETRDEHAARLRAAPHVPNLTKIISMIYFKKKSASLEP